MVDYKLLHIKSHSQAKDNKALSGEKYKHVNTDNENRGRHDYDVVLVKDDKNLDQIKLDEPNMRVTLEVNSSESRDRGY